MALNWRNPDLELPKQDEVVWVRIDHWKKDQVGPQACEIYCGEVIADTMTGEVVVWNNDNFGAGSRMWVLHNPKPWMRTVDSAAGWLPVNELNVE